MESNAHKLAILAQGQQAEIQALRLLESKGLVLVAQNHRCRCGEIDLIMAHGDTAVVVEVRLRSNSRHGSALESISRQKTKPRGAMRQAVVGTARSTQIPAPAF